MKTKTKKENKKSSKFLSGALVGATLAIAAEIFSNSEKGKELKKEVKDKVADFYKTVAPKIKKAKVVGEKEYKVFMEKALADYNKDGRFSAEDFKNLTKQAHTSWKHLKKHL